MANTPYHSSGFVISYPPVLASVSIDITSFATQIAVPPNTSSLLNINGINICFYRSGVTPPPNTSNTIYIVTTAGTFLSDTTNKFNQLSVVSPYDAFWSNITASNDGASDLNLTAKNNTLETQNYYYTSGSTTVPFSDPIFDRISGSFTGFTVVSNPSSIVPVVRTLKDYSGKTVLSNDSLPSTNTTYNQYISYIEITSGSLLLYSTSLTTPQL
jgi:hypothetical protein